MCRQSGGPFLLNSTLKFREDPVLRQLTTLRHTPIKLWTLNLWWSISPLIIFEIPLLHSFHLTPYFSVDPFKTYSYTNLHIHSLHFLSRYNIGVSPPDTLCYSSPQSPLKYLEIPTHRSYLLHVPIKVRFNTFVCKRRENSYFTDNFI